MIRLIAILLVVSLGPEGAVFAAPPGATVTNQAFLNYENMAGQPAVVASNEVSVVTAVVRSPATVELTRVIAAGTGTYQETVGPAACLSGGAFVTLADPVLTGGTAIDPAATQEVSAASSYNLGEPLFIRVADSDQNVDYQVNDTLTVDVINAASGDTETVQLYETGPDTGVFTGYIPSERNAAVPGDCLLQGATDSSVRVSYTDVADPLDTAEASAVLDPVSVVFESRTGSMVDGIEVEIVDVSTGLPATVYGNDGISVFPSSIVSGSTVTDSSGATYVFGTGEYRFPVVPPGNYRLDVTPNSAYTAPSGVSISDLQQLPGAPYALTPASFGASFAQAGPVPFDVDLPIDPQSSALFLQKRTLTTSAAPGDFVRYELTLENTSNGGIANSVTITDHLPHGVRFVSGSVMTAGQSAPDPAISDDGSVLVFDVPDVNAGGRTSLNYVVEIVAGERGDELVNAARANAAGGLESNDSTATIRLTEDLFRSTGTIIGRILEADCSQETFAEDQGVPNVRVYLQDGRYAVSDAGGRFHFEGLDAGTHVAQIDPVTVPEYFDIIGCHETSGFSGSAEAQFVRLSRGGLHRADFYLRRKEPPRGSVDIELRNSASEEPDQVVYDVRLSGSGNVDINNLSLMTLMPEGVSYVPDSLRLNEQPISEPHIVGPSLTIGLPAQSAGWTLAVQFRGVIEAGIEGELVTKAVARFDTAMDAEQKTPLVETRMSREAAVVENAGYVLDLKFGVLSAELSIEDKQELESLIADWQGVESIQLSATGHSDSQRIAPRNHHLFENNYVLSQARAMAAAFYVANALDIPTANIQVEGRGPDDPVADNTTADGRRKNRRVEMTITGMRPTRPSFLELTQKSSGTLETATTGAVPGMEPVKRKRVVDKEAGMPSSQIVPSPDTLAPGYAMLLPEKGFAPAIPATKVAVQHEPGQTVELTINGEPVNPLNFAGAAGNAAGTVALSTWTGVDLVDGPNEFRAVVWNADGTRAKGIRRTIHYTGGPIRGEIDPELSTLVADGKTAPVIAVRLFDRSGKPARAGVVGRFRVDDPYRSAWDEENDRKNALVEIGDRSATYRVDADGVAYLELAPTTKTGEATVFLPFENSREQEIRAWLKPAQRDWILVGFAEGTAAHRTISDNLVAAAEAGFEEGYTDEGKVSFFAKGSIKGEFLLTLAYDSDRDRDDNRDRFDTVVDPNAYYSLYADSAEQRFEAPSQRNIYVKLERNQFYALFGDFDTGLSVAELARYQRNFNGFKSEYRGDNLGYTAFAAETDQAFNRDEIRGDGTSGLYQLSNAPIIANSDNIRLEVRDRFDSGVVISEQKLSRFLDYTLDTLTGTLYFKKPVPSRDLDFNPIYIVAEYESITAGTNDVVAGVRGSLRFADDSLEIGVTHINDATAGAEADLSGVDIRWQMNEQTLLKVEMADSNTIRTGAAEGGSAQKVEIEHNSETLDIKAFVREVDEDFGLGQQSAADAGVRRLGLDARKKVGERFVVEGEAGWQQNLLTEDIRNLARAVVRYEKDDFTARLGFAHAEDEFEDGEKKTSQLIEAGVSKRIMDGKLRLHTSGSFSLSKDAESLDYPQRYVVGADYRIRDGIDIIAEYEDASGESIDASMARVGVRATPWSRAQINSFIGNETSEFGPRLFANIGLIQGFQLNERWTMDIGLDRAETLTGSGARQFDSDRELSSGSGTDDFTAAYAGALYTSEMWSANSRIEFRDSTTEERVSLLFGWYRQPNEGHGLSAGLTVFTSDNATGGEMSQTNLRFGWAYRPADSKWAFLNRVDLIADTLLSDTTDQENWRLINNLTAHRRVSAATALSLQYAFKYVRSNFDSLEFSGYTDLIGVDLRHGFRDRWDAGVSTSIYHSYQSGVFDYGFGMDVGYNIGRNMWLSLGYNFDGFEDDDFSAARYTASGPYLRFVIKADQHLLKRIAGRRR